MKKLVALTFALIMTLSFVGCSGVSETPPYEPLKTSADTVDYDYYYPPVDMIEVDYVEDWMLPKEGILTFAEKTEKGYSEFTIGALNGSKYDEYVSTLEANGMEMVEEKIYENGTVRIRLSTTVFNRNPGMNGDVYTASYLDVYIYDLR